MRNRRNHPSTESSNAGTYTAKIAKERSKYDIIIVNLSGCGD
jgi:tryptophan synthase beta subunit